MKTKLLLLLLFLALGLASIFAQNCTNWAVTPDTQYDVPSSGGIYSAQVTATGQCKFNIFIDNFWLHFDSWGTNGIFYYRVDSNTVGARSGTITILDQTDGGNNVASLTVNQLEGSNSITNDECYNAISLIPSSNYNYITGSTLGATESQPPSSDCSFILATANDVWYKFTATCVNNIVQVQGDSWYDAVLEVEDAPCGNLVGFCEDNTGDGGIETADLNNLTIGKEYYIRVYEVSSSYDSDFEICVQTPNSCPPPETYCNNAITLTPNSSCNYINGSTNNAILTQVTDCNNDYPANYVNAVWYKFTAECEDEYNYKYGEIIKVQSSPGFDAAVQLVSGCNSDGSGRLTLGCEDNTDFGGLKTIEDPYLTIGNTYYIMVYSNNSPGDFQICVTHSCSDGIQKIIDDDNISIYPNPTNNKFSIEIDNRNESYNLEILNTIGQVVLNKKITNNVEQVDLSGQSAGVYFVKLQSGNNTIVKKVIKQN